MINRMANNAPVSREGVTNVVPTHVLYSSHRDKTCSLYDIVCDVFCRRNFKDGDRFERFSCYILHTDTSLAVMNGF
jgi:hypothetical protein